jgi:hypothetical protein
MFGVKRCIVLKFGHFGKKQIRRTREVLKCGAGEGWRRSVGRIVGEEELQRVKEKRNILHEIKEGMQTGLVTSCIGTAF